MALGENGQFVDGLSGWVGGEPFAEATSDGAAFEGQIAWCVKAIRDFGALGAPITPRQQIIGMES